jgi:hypothetical protein
MYEFSVVLENSSSKVQAGNYQTLKSQVQKEFSSLLKFELVS